MQISTDADETDLLSAIIWLRNKIGGLLRKKIHAFRELEKLSELYRQYHLETFDLELDLIDHIDFLRIHKHLRRPLIADHALNFAVVAHRIWLNLDRQAQEKFDDRLREHTSFSQVYGLRPLAFELTVAAHFLGLGCDVDYNDLISGKGADFLVKKNNETTEVECKSFSADAGRRIDQKNLCTLGGYLLPVIENHLPSRGLRVARLTIKISLNELDEAAFRRIASSVQTAFLENSPQEEGEDYQVKPDPEIHLLPTGPLSPDVIKRHINDHFSGLNKHILIRASKKEGRAVAIIISHILPDAVVDKLKERILKGVHQCSRSRASLIAVQVADLRPENLVELFKTPGSGIHVIAHDIFNGTPKNPHVNAISFSVLPVPDRPDTHASATTVSASVVVLRNDHPKFPSQILGEKIFSN